MGRGHARFKSGGGGGGTETRTKKFPVFQNPLQIRFRRQPELGAKNSRSAAAAKLFRGGTTRPATGKARNGGSQRQPKVKRGGAFCAHAGSKSAARYGNKAVSASAILRIRKLGSGQLRGAARAHAAFLIRSPADGPGANGERLLRGTVKPLCRAARRATSTIGFRGRMGFP